jgi:hypothetical protein
MGIPQRQVVGVELELDRLGLARRDEDLLECDELPPRRGVPI